jgi:imidazolonepropionase-like amidohydrolase
MAATLFSNVMVLDGLKLASFPGEVLVEGERIREVAATRGSIAVERAGEFVDGEGMTLMPGLVEGHCHLSFVGVSNRRDLGEIPVEEHLMRTMRNAQLLLDHGFTSAFSAASAKMRLDVVIRDEIAAGQIAGPRLRAASPEITVTAGLGDESRWRMGASGSCIVADGPEEIRKAVRLAIRESVDTIKINIAGDDILTLSPSGMTAMTEAEISTAVETAHGCGKMIACQARAAESVKRAVRHGVDCITQCDLADEEALDMLEAVRERVFIAPAVGLAYNAMFEGEAAGISKEAAERMGLPRTFEHAKATYQQLRKRGLRMVIGGGYGFAIAPMGQNARDIGHFVDFFGYSPAEALRCATIVGGELMGARGEIGVIKPGALADLLLVEGDPLRDVKILADRNRLAAIMQAGRFHKAKAPRLAALRQAAE